MAFLDNSGDIILDAVLTDAGRQRMARGEFKIVKFAFSDEEINYETYDPNHPSGSAFSDLQIMQTPILESFTNNTSLMKTKLISISRNNILYLPILRLNNKDLNDTEIFSDNHGGFYLSANNYTDTQITFQKGVLPFGTSQANQTKYIWVDQGLDTGGNPDVTQPLPSDLVETAFLIRVDHRLLRMHRGNTTQYAALTNSFIDDDAIATYYVPSTDAAVQTGRTEDYDSDDVSNNNFVNYEMFDGPLGTRLKLFVKTSANLQANAALFDELGTAVADDTGFPGTLSAGYKYIDTVINVVGVTTGYSLDIPIRILRVENA